MDAAVLSVATLAVNQGVSAFTSFLPPISDIRRANPADNPDVAADIRMGEVAAITLTVGIGAVCSSLSGSNVPIVVAVTTSLILIALYESTLRADRPFEATKVTLAPVPDPED